MKEGKSKLRIRTIRETIKLIKEADPDTALSEKTLRRAVKNGEIPHRMAGSRVLLDVDYVSAYYGCLETNEEEQPIENEE